MHVNFLSGPCFWEFIRFFSEQATDGTLASENWDLNMEICDLVNKTEDGPRDAVKAIRKRLAQNAGKNYTIVMYTLIVLETCVKNCGKKFHVLICIKDFVLDLVKLIGPKNDPPTAVQEKVLSLIQSWANAFRNQPEMSGVVSAYQDLLAKGIEFPATDLDSMAPIHTPQRASVEVKIPVAVELEVSRHSSPTPHVSSGFLTLEQGAKLQSQLDVVQSNMNVLGEMLREIKPGNEQPDELELLQVGFTFNNFQKIRFLFQELHVTCQSMQERLVELISKLSNDELTAELLCINDDLNNLFIRYSRWEKNRDTGKHSASAVLAKAIPPSSKPPLESDDSLIDFGDDLLSTGTSVSTQLSKIETVTAKNVHSKGDDEFDMFAQSRNVSYENSKISGSTYKDNLEPDKISGGLSTVTQGKHNTPPDLEFDEMAHWLGQTKEKNVTSSEFERFLTERAAAAE
ncbi:VHS and/or GAT domain containing protein [Asbolus verrucosus]|uniref:VHS and/or GAT domain containing protein n=1 Tax=Asbolus verrucosus TaxID=1661398 RepID=A0A482VVN9_ASBVE|nr:VHS and/or GAT domain containing protein [Asbolus verrucosus]